MRVCVLILLCLGVATFATAQEESRPVPLTKAAVTCPNPACEAVIDTLNRHITNATAAALQGFAFEHLQTLKSSGPEPLKEALGDIETNFYRFVWVGKDDAAQPVVRSIVVHKDARRPVDTLPGITDKSAAQLIDLFISPDPNAVIDTRYISTLIKDPLVAQIPKFIEDSKIIAFLAGVSALRGAPTFNTYTVSRATLPLARASVAIKDTIVIPGSAAALRTDAIAARDRVIIREARLSQCARTLAAAHAEAISEGVMQEPCTLNTNQPGVLGPTQAASCKAFLLEQLAETYRRTMTTCSEPPAAGVDSVLFVDKQFNDLVGTLKETRRPLESRVLNTPRTRFTLGGLTAAMTGSPLYGEAATRAKVGSNGTLVLDPLPTLMTMAIVNIHPTTYDASSDAITAGERFRAFAGTVITPDFGITAGVGVAIIRGLSANVGWANLFIKTPASGFAIGSSASSGSPLQVSQAGVFYAGLGFNFK
jgi:hypothetical protein